VLITSVLQQTNLPELFLSTVKWEKDMKYKMQWRSEGGKCCVFAIRVACLVHTRYLCHENESFW